MSRISLAPLYFVQVSDRGVAPYYTSPVKTESESSGEDRSFGQATVEFLFQLGAEYLARLVATSVNTSVRDVSSIKQIHVIYQTRETVFHLDIQTPRREFKIRHAAEYLTKFELFG